MTALLEAQADAVAATTEKFNRLWDVNLEVREKLCLPQEESDPSVDMLFEGRRQ